MVAARGALAAPSAAGRAARHASVQAHAALGMRSMHSIPYRAQQQQQRAVSLNSGGRISQPGGHRRLSTLRAALPAKPGRACRHFCRASMSAVPPAQGLVDPGNDKDACGVGFCGDLSRQPSRSIVTDALKMLARMTHRGACGCEENTGARGRGEGFGQGDR